MLMIGTNNSHNDQSVDVAKGIRKVLDIIAAKQPQATTLLLPIFPRGATAKDKLRVKNEKVNAIIKGYADGKKVVWCDFNAKFLDAEGNLPKKIMPDLLHPNREGYIIWRDAVLPHFQAICGK
jgi:lysophospholipase L1-like esterase